MEGWCTAIPIHFEWLDENKIEKKNRLGNQYFGYLWKFVIIGSIDIIYEI